MGRKEFVRDCIAASEWIERGFAQTVAQRERVAGVARHPAEDGVVVVSCRGPLHNELAEDDAEVWVRIDDLHKYPASHRDVLVYTPSHHVHLSATLADLSASRALCARTVSDAIAILSAALKIQCPAIAVPHSTATIATTTTEAVEQSDKGISDLDQVDEELDLQDTDSDDDDDIFITHPSVRYATSASASHSRLATSSSHITPASDASLRARLIKDLKLCTRAPSTTLPLKAGVLWEKGDGEFVIYTLMSIRTLLSSHVLSWDQVKAWNLPLDAHVVVLTKFLHEYAFVNSDGIQEPAPRPQFRVQLSSSADLDELEVFAAFRQNWKFSGGTSEGGAEMTAVGHLHEFLLSAPLSDLLNGRFLALLGLRLKLACS
ncbi:hypothetical protein BC830DRAFT_813199 [Chytriomyces sp. MP71]|nr:hypothetical protein BC830DRAFT_813199 [Chytriomyces sp. MP71]